MQQGLELTQPPIQFADAIHNTWRRRIKVFLLYLLFINIFGTLIKSPLSLIYLVFGGYPMLFVYLIFTTVYLVDKLLIKKAGFNVYEVIILMLLGYIMIQAGFVTNFYFGQPIFLGMSAEKSWLAILSGIFMFYLLKSKSIDLTMVRDSLLFGAWFNLPIYMAMILGLNPNQFAGTLFVYCNSIKGGCQFEFDIFGFAFATIYYFIRYVRTSHIKYALYFMGFFAYIFFINQKRGTSIALLGTVGLYFLLNATWEKIIYYTSSFILFISAALGGLWLLRPDILERVTLMYTNVILALQGEETGEASADARIRETAIAFKYFNKHSFSWFFGNGKINNDWLGGPTAELGHFYASDIGILGVVYQFGVLGLMLGLTQYWLVYRTHQRLRKEFRKDYFYQAILFFIIFFIVRGIPTGGSFFDPGMAIAASFVAIHYFFYYIQLHPERNYRWANKQVLN
ncbi:MAG: hypothetical protein IPO83_10730 [Chitinophagaceae bacterium]|nr:hypothetical protein [Chitinophagaceae bacterium]